MIFRDSLRSYLISKCKNPFHIIASPVLSGSNNDDYGINCLLVFKTLLQFVFKVCENHAS